MSWTAERARVASLTRSREPDDPDLVAARGNLKVERLANYIERVVAEAPPLTMAQRDRLTTLLRTAPTEPRTIRRPREVDEQFAAASPDDPPPPRNDVAEHRGGAH